jgi:hypothetical protein
VDNSCYAVRTDVARKHSHAWYVPIVSDRAFQAELMRAAGSSAALPASTASATGCPTMAPAA